MLRHHTTTTPHRSRARSLSLSLSFPANQPITIPSLTRIARSLALTIVIIYSTSKARTHARSTNSAPLLAYLLTVEHKFRQHHPPTHSLTNLTNPPRPVLRPSFGPITTWQTKLVTEKKRRGQRSMITHTHAHARPTGRPYSDDYYYSGYVLSITCICTTIAVRSIDID